MRMGARNAAPPSLYQTRGEGVQDCWRSCSLAIPPNLTGKSTLSTWGRLTMSEREEFFLTEDPLTGEPLREEPQQLELKEPVEGQFSRNAKAIIKQHAKGLRDADR